MNPLILFPIGMIVYGLLCLFNRDLLYKVFNPQAARGIPAPRPDWDRQMMLLGAIALPLGFAVLYLLIF